MVTSVPWQLQLQPGPGPSTATELGARPRAARAATAAARRTTPVPPEDDAADVDCSSCEVGPVAHGGHCVARHDGRVVFVRHALPGERVLAAVTEDAQGLPARRRGRDPRAVAGPGRAAVPVRRPGRLRRLRLAARRAGRPAGAEGRRSCASSCAGWPALTATRRRAGVACEPLPGGPLGWRTRVQYAVDAAGRAGLHQHRSHEVVPVDRCLIAHPADPGAAGDRRAAGRPARPCEVVAAPAARPRVLTRADRSVPLAGPPGRVRERRRRARLERRRRRVLAGAPGRRRHARRRGPGDARARARGSGPGTSTAAPACSPPRWRRSAEAGHRGRGRPPGRRRRP